MFDVIIICMPPVFDVRQHHHVIIERALYLEEETDRVEIMFDKKVHVPVHRVDVKAICIARKK